MGIWDIYVMNGWLIHRCFHLHSIKINQQWSWIPQEFSSPSFPRDGPTAGPNAESNLQAADLRANLLGCRAPVSAAAGHLEWQQFPQPMCENDGKYGKCHNILSSLGDLNVLGGIQTELASHFCSLLISLSLLGWQKQKGLVPHITLRLSGANIQ